MDTRSDARILPVAIMTAIEMTILRFSSTQNDRRISTTVVSFPLPTSSSRSTVRPTELLPATFASVSSSVERSFYFLLSEFIFIHHFLENQSLHQEIRLSLNVECVKELSFSQLAVFLLFYQFTPLKNNGFRCTIIMDYFIMVYPTYDDVISIIQTLI